MHSFSYNSQSNVDVDFLFRLVCGTRAKSLSAPCKCIFYTLRFHTESFSLSSITQFIFTMETDYVSCEVGTESLCLQTRLQTASTRGINQTSLGLQAIRESKIRRLQIL
jgi:hypothetical protein